MKRVKLYEMGEQNETDKMRETCSLVCQTVCSPNRSVNPAGQPPILRGHSDQGHWVQPLRTPAYTQLNKNPPRTHLGSLVSWLQRSFQLTFLIVSLHLTAAGKRNSLKSKQKWQKKIFSSMMEKNSFHSFEKDKI